MAIIICEAPRCSVEKKETNHWFIVAVDNRGGFRCKPYTPEVYELWQPTGSTLPGLIHERIVVCGAACATKCFDFWMINKRLPKKGERL